MFKLKIVHFQECSPKGCLQNHTHMFGNFGFLSEIRVIRVSNQCNQISDYFEIECNIVVVAVFLLMVSSQSKGKLSLRSHSSQFASNLESISLECMSHSHYFRQ